MFEAMDRVFGLEIQEVAKLLDRRLDGHGVPPGHFRNRISRFVEDVTAKQPIHTDNGPPALQPPRYSTAA